MILTKRSQITAFLLLAIVILISFSFAFFLSFKSKVDPIKDNAYKVGKSSDEVQKVKSFVTGCLRESAKEGILLIGKQGGYIFSGQNYSIINFRVPNATYLGDPVAYLIYRDVPHVMSPPEYPCFSDTADKHPSEKGLSCYTSYNHLSGKYRFGTFNYMPEGGIYPDLCSHVIDLGEYECGCSFCNRNVSIEDQLEAYIKDATLDCANFSMFKNLVVMVRDNASVDVAFSDESVIIDFKLPLIVKSSHGIPLTEVVHFRDSVPARLRVLYNLLFSPEISTNGFVGGIWQDTRNVSFNIVKDLQDIANRKYSHIKVYSQRISEDTDIVTIEDTDPKHSLGGENLIFRFARENRAPALDYIDNFHGKPYNLYVVAGEKLLISPLGYDPDEGELTYVYSGWKATTDDVYHSPSCDGSAIIYNETGLPISTNLWHNSDEYIDGCFHPFYGFTTKNCASIQTSCHDVGYHDMQVFVYDKSGLYDFQNIKVLVDSKPKSVLEFYNKYLYPGIPQNFGSIEDPFVINASKTEDALNKGSLLYHFSIFDPADSSVVFDFGPDRRDSYTFPLIDTGISGILPELFDKEGTYRITVEVNKEAGDPEIMSSSTEYVSVAKCIPHRSNSAPYPFNALNDKIRDGLVYEPNDYLGNHSCCLGNIDEPASWELAQSSRTCYHLEDYGCRADFVGSSKETVIPSSITGTITPVDPVGQKNDGDITDDIYVRRIERKCSGLRGNMCDGRFTDKSVSFYTSCPAPGTDKGCSVCEYGSRSCVLQDVGTVCNQTPTGKLTCKGCDSSGKCTLDVSCT